jgi:hypothetical protein
MPEPRIPSVPDDWSVWAFSDCHGVTSGLVTALQQAGLIDEARRWCAPPQTALIGCGDYIDRGGDVRGTVDLLRRLVTEATVAGGVVHLAKGNHEVMPRMAREGVSGSLARWLEYGGRATLQAYGCDSDLDTDPELAARTLATCAPDLFTWMAELPEAVRWRDVLFVHGGLPLHQRLSDFGVNTEDHLWIRSAYFETAWESDAFSAYQRDGIGRVVFGHTPQPDGPATFHGGHSLNIDTNAVGNPRFPPGTRRRLTLLGLDGDRSFDEARLISIDTEGAPDSFLA